MRVSPGRVGRGALDSRTCSCKVEDMTESQYVPQADDDEPVIFGYDSSRNVSFHDEDESGYTKGEWRRMTEDERSDALQEFLNEIVEVYAKD